MSFRDRKKGSQMVSTLKFTMNIGFRHLFRHIITKQVGLVAYVHSFTSITFCIMYSAITWVTDSMPNETETSRRQYVNRCVWADVISQKIQCGC